MTVTTNKTPQAQKIVVRDEIGALAFAGETVADLSWSYDAAYERGHSRWTDITLYRVRERNSQYAYVIQITGRSVLYHRVGGPCHHGVAMPVRLLREDEERYDNLVSCRTPGCQPADLDDMGDTDKVAVEEDLYTLYKCKDAVEVVEIMQNRGGSRERMSGLSAKMLQAASRVDKSIEEAMAQTRGL